MIDGVSKTYPISNLQPEHLKDHTFKPTIFFSKCSILVEGPADEAAITAISDSLGRIFEQYSIEIINTGGKSVIENYIPILKAYSIPHVVLTDYDYCCDDNKPIPRQRGRTSDFIVLPQRLEEVLHIFDQSINIIRNFDAADPCKTTKKNQPKSVDPSRAYEIISKAMSNERTKVKQSQLGGVVDKAVRKACYPVEITNIWRYQNRKKKVIRGASAGMDKPMIRTR
ncbi:MAG: TOPRIM nucleotidyl transferase/hydrolase domain-containing protein [Candidatus Nitrosopolaris sp.]